MIPNDQLNLKSTANSKYEKLYFLFSNFIPCNELFRVKNNNTVEADNKVVVKYVMIALRQGGNILF